MKKALTCDDIRQLEQLPNVGKATVADLHLLGITDPQQLKGRDPYQMYDELCAVTKVRHDPCVYDVFISIVKFMDGEPPLAWWHYTAERKAYLASPSSQ
ncbi:helix-hairpin-helix domain-containing protein [Undibacterium sp. Di26W]|uniref:helix-hairpin-helix domain-containing protein n=1 Tax=Undibacterium sp. Di26W TaxID=3413035 RepID=UPI003BF3D073